MDLKRTEPSLDLGNNLKSVSNNSGSKMENGKQATPKESKFKFYAID